MTAAPAQTITPITTQPWAEAVISVSDLGRTAAFFTEVGGYEVRWRGIVPRANLKHWGLPEAVRAEAVLLAAEGAESGFVRLIRFDDANGVPTRPGARPWDTGCHFSLMLRGRDLERRYQEAIALGWWSESDLISLEFGGSKLKNVIFKGPDGVNIAVYERLSPPLAAFWRDFQRLSQPFNAMQTVRDRDRTLAFFTEVLGFDVYYKGEPSTASEPTYSNFSIPTDLTTRLPTLAGIVEPIRGEVGRMEFIQFMDLAGEDYANRCLPPNLGIISIRYPVADAAAASGIIRARNWPVLFDVASLSMTPYGPVTSFAIQAPDGAMIEFFSVD
jgi:catechol 2,3-dioxygenase-like lactoylglutathione lyase family enzyme